MNTEFNEKGHPMVFSDESVNTDQLKDKCIKAIESLSGVHGAAERKAQACFMIALSELENNWKQRAEAAEAKLVASVPVYQYESAIYNEENGDTDWYWDDCDKGFYDQYNPSRRRILFTRPASAADLDELVPPGWKIVPEKPTEEMIIAVSKGLAERVKPSRYKAMLTAAPILRRIEEAK